jgi:hypothetical protein
MAGVETLVWEKGKVCLRKVGEAACITEVCGKRKGLAERVIRKIRVGPVNQGWALGRRFLGKKIEFTFNR